MINIIDKHVVLLNVGIVVVAPVRAVETPKPVKLLTAAGAVPNPVKAGLTVVFPAAVLFVDEPNANGAAAVVFTAGAPKENAFDADVVAGAPNANGVVVAVVAAGAPKLNGAVVVVVVVAAAGAPNAGTAVELAVFPVEPKLKVVFAAGAAALAVEPKAKEFVVVAAVPEAAGFEPKRPVVLVDGA